MKIGYNKLICSLPILLAVLLGALTVYAKKQGIPTDNKSTFLIAGLLILSVPMLFVSYIVVTEKEIIINNQFGMPRRRASFTSLKDIKFENGNLMVTSNGVTNKLRFNKILVDPKGIKAFKVMVDNAK